MEEGHQKDSTDEHLRNKKKWRNVATRLERSAIREYWREKTEEMNSNPEEFYKVFNPFLYTHTHTHTHKKKINNQNNEIHLNVNGSVEKDQRNVAKHADEPRFMKTRFRHGLG